MSFSVNTNANALVAIQTLSQTNKSLAINSSRINSGLKVGGAKDDASTFAIAQGMRGDIAGFKAISESLALGESTTNVALTSAEQISNLLNKIKGKVVQAQEDNVDRTAIQRDIDQYVQQVDGIAKAAQFNGVNLLDGSVTGNLDVMSSLNRSGGSFTPVKLSIAGQDLTAASLGIDGINVTNGYSTLTFAAAWDPATADTLTITAGASTYVFEMVDDPTTEGTTAAENIAVDVTTGGAAGPNIGALIGKLEEEGFSASYNDQGGLVISHSAGDVTVASSNADITSAATAGGNRATAMTDMETAINSVKTSLSTLGAAMNRLEIQGEFVKNLTDTMEIGVGKLVDADMAAESAQLQALQVRQQLGMQALSIANQQPGSVLSLFR